MLNEVVNKAQATVHSLVSTSASLPERNIDQIVDINRFCNLTKLLRVTTLMIKAAKSFKNQVAKVKIAEKEQLTLSAVELKEAECCWIQSVQGSFFFKEMAFLLSKDHRSTPPTCHTVWIVLRQRSYQVQGETEQCTAACELEEPHSTASEARIYPFIDQAVTRVCQTQWHKGHLNDITRTLLGTVWARTCEEICL